MYVCVCACVYITYKYMLSTTMRMYTVVCIYYVSMYIHREVHANVGTYMHSYICRRRFATSAMPKKGATMHSACQ